METACPVSRSASKHAVTVIIDSRGVPLITLRTSSSGAHAYVREQSRAVIW